MEDEVLLEAHAVVIVWHFNRNRGRKFVPELQRSGKAVCHHDGLGT